MTNNYPFRFYCRQTDTYPNSRMPVLLYKGAIQVPFLFRRLGIKRDLARQGWTNAAVRRLPSFPHYHSNNHVVLIVLCGSGILELGGLNGERIRVQRNDGLIIPAGVAYCQPGREGRIRFLAAWPGGIPGNIHIGPSAEVADGGRREEKVLMPVRDPIYGDMGHLPSLWAGRS